MFTIRWKEFKKHSLITLEKAFNSESDMDKFFNKLQNKKSFYQVLSWTAIEGGN